MSRSSRLLLISTAVLVWHVASVCAQDAATREPSLPGGVTLSFFADAYYAFDVGRPDDHERPDFLYNHSRAGEFTVNLALLSARYESEWLRGALGLQAGTWPQANSAHEHELLRPIYEAWVGLAPAASVWIDAGIFGSHLGFESAVSIDNPTLTRSLQAENSPYYLAGARITWRPQPAWTLAAIAESPANSTPGGGTQVQFAPVEGVLVNASTWVSNEAPDEAPQLRLFHDLYALATLDDLTVAIGFDGREPRAAAAALRWNTRP